MHYFIEQDATRQERQAKDRLSREKDVLIAEKFQLEQNLAVSFPPLIGNVKVLKTNFIIGHPS